MPNQLHGFVLINQPVAAIHESPSPIVASCGSYHANDKLDNLAEAAKPLR
jgi:hypothetical protein